MAGAHAPRPVEEVVRPEPDVVTTPVQANLVQARVTLPVLDRPGHVTTKLAVAVSSSE